MYKFDLDEYEQKQADAFMDKHRACYEKLTSNPAIGGQYTFMFTPTGIGTFAAIQCGI